jgi:muramoyltetrapeptide carboxypeptidase
VNKSNHIPPYLQQGNKIAIVATARKITLDEITPAIDLIKSWGLIPVIGNSIDTAHHQFADTDPKRTADLQYFLDQADIRAIWCARGGYGTARIIDQLKWKGFKQHPKWIIGYSDITALHAQVWQQTEIATLHATMPINISSNTPNAISTLQQTLWGKPCAYEALPAHPLNRMGKAKGRLIGGNLSVLYSLIGTASAPKPQGNILFIEDLDEYLYHIDRMMLSLYRSGFLAKLAGIVIGSMTDMKDNAVPFGSDAYEIIAHYTQSYNYPRLFNFPAGHIADNRALIIGGNYALNVAPAQCSLVNG